MQNDACQPFADRVLDLRASWIASDDDDPPEELFDALRALYAAVDADAPQRWRDAAPYLRRVVERLDASENDAQALDLASLWADWEDAALTVDRYDRRERRRNETPRLTVAELRRQGVTDAQICAIYGLSTVKNGGPAEPDFRALSKIARTQELDDAPLKGGGRRAADPSEAGEPPIYSETKTENGNDPSRKFEEKIIEATSCNNGDFFEIDERLENGSPVRQIAASLNVDVEKVKERADKLGIKPAESANDLSPRLQKACVDFFRKNKGATYEEVAAACSTATRPITREEAQKALLGDQQKQKRKK